MKLIHWLGWLVAVIAIILVYRRDLRIAALEAARDAPAPVSAVEVTAPPAPSPILAPPPATTDATAQMLARISELETQLAESLAVAEAANAETERYRGGLENAVAELNRQTRSDRERQTAPPRSATRPASAVRVWTPETSHVDSDLVIAGKVHNLGAEATEGAVVVEVYDGSELIGEDRIALTLEGRSLGDYYVRMPVPRRDLTVKARWESF